MLSVSWVWLQLFFLPRHYQSWAFKPRTKEEILTEKSGVNLFLGNPVKNHKLSRIVREMKKHAEAGHQCFLKWTCEKCGQRATANEPNRVSRLMLHEDCGHITDLAHSGCNFLLIMKNQTIKDLEQYLKTKVD